MLNLKFLLLVLIISNVVYVYSLSNYVVKLQNRKVYRNLQPMSMKAAISFPSINSDKTSGLFQATNIFSPFTKFWTVLTSLLSSIFLKKSESLRKVKSNTDAMENGWKKRGLGGSFSRTVEVWLFAITYLIKFLKVERLKNSDKETYSKAKTEIAIILRDKLLELGPTFIKLGQLLSTRIDILSREFIDALILLQDQVPGFPGEISVKIIEKEFGKPIDQIFESFDIVPIAAASLGQVHVATLNGKKVAVKIQRQGLRDLFDMDLKNIKVLAQLLDKFDPKTDGAQRDWVSIYDESAKLLYKEIDYENEAYNAIRFRTNFLDTPWIKVPEVYLNLTSTTVLTMEYVPGIKINDIERIDAAGINRELLSKRSAESYLSQLCRYGFFHCDPHPGNLACDAVEGGRLIYYDFGMMDELSTGVKTGLVNLIFGIYENDPRAACDALEEMGILRPGVDRISIEKIGRSFLKEFLQGVETGQWVNQLTKAEQKELRKKRRLQLAADLFTVGADVPFKFPPTFTFVFRAFTSLDGIGKGLDPKYDLTRLTQPYLKELIDLRDGSATLSLLKSWGKQVGLRPVDIANAVTSPRKIANVETILSKMEQGDLKLRVRVLESERSFQKMEIVQNNMGLAVAASAFVNMGLLLANLNNPTGQFTLASKAMLSLGAYFGLQIPIGFFKLKSLEKKFSTFK